MDWAPAVKIGLFSFSSQPPILHPNLLFLKVGEPTGAEESMMQAPAGGDGSYQNRHTPLAQAETRSITTIGSSLYI